LAYGLFKFQVSAAARALFSLGVCCGTVLLLLGKKNVHLRGQHCPICVLKAKVSIFTFYLFPCVFFKIPIGFIFYIAQLIFIITICNLVAA
jgi:hypothetical protein